MHVSRVITGLLSLVMTHCAFGATGIYPSVIEPEYFGMHVHWNDTSTRLHLPHMGSLRLWDTRTTWSNLEPRRGHWNFEKLDRHVELATGNGFSLLLTLGGTPRWASRTPNLNGPYGPGSGSPPERMVDWDNYVKTVAERYKGRIRYYEILNEPVFAEEGVDCNRAKVFWCGTASEMVEIARRTREVVLGIDPTAKIVAPGFAGTTSSRQELFFAAGGGKYVDVIAHHFYALNPEQMVERIRLVKDAMVRYRLDNLELWNTESGYVLGDPERKGPVKFASYLTHEMMADTVAQSLILAASEGIRRFFWYAWDNGPTGLATPDGTKALPGGIAYSQIQDWLVGSTVKDCRKRDKSWICSRYTDGRLSRIVWSSNLSEFRPDPGWKVVEYQSVGSESSRVEGSSIRIGPTPTLLISIDGR